MRRRRVCLQRYHHSHRRLRVRSCPVDRHLFLPHAQVLVTPYACRHRPVCKCAPLVEIFSRSSLRTASIATHCTPNLFPRCVFLTFTQIPCHSTAAVLAPPMILFLLSIFKRARVCGVQSPFSVSQLAKHCFAARFVSLRSSTCTITCVPVPTAAFCAARCLTLTLALEEKGRERPGDGCRRGLTCDV